MQNYGLDGTRRQCKIHAFDPKYSGDDKSVKLTLVTTVTEAEATEIFSMSLAQLGAQTRRVMMESMGTYKIVAVLDTCELHGEGEVKNVYLDRKRSGNMTVDEHRQGDLPGVEGPERPVFYGELHFVLEIPAKGEMRDQIYELFTNQGKFVEIAFEERQPDLTFDEQTTLRHYLDGIKKGDSNLCHVIGTDRKDSKPDINRAKKMAAAIARQQPRARVIHRWIAQIEKQDAEQKDLEGSDPLDMTAILAAASNALSAFDQVERVEAKQADNEGHGPQNDVVVVIYPIMALDGLNEELEGLYRGCMKALRPVSTKHKLTLDVHMHGYTDTPEGTGGGDTPETAPETSPAIEASAEADDKGKAEPDPGEEAAKEAEKAGEPDPEPKTKAKAKPKTKAKAKAAPAPSASESAGKLKAVTDMTDEELVAELTKLKGRAPSVKRRDALQKRLMTARRGAGQHVAEAASA